MFYSLWFPPPKDQWKSPLDDFKIDPAEIRRAVENYTPPEHDPELEAQLAPFRTRVTWKDLMIEVD